MSHNEQLKQKVIRAIEASDLYGRAVATSEMASENNAVRAVTFRDYMAMALYEEEHGYYKSGAVRVGKDGDFYTSPTIGSVLADRLAVYIQREYESSDKRLPPIYEWGAGTGRLAVSFVQAWLRLFPERADELRYTAIDGNPVHVRACATCAEEAGLGGFIECLKEEEALQKLICGEQSYILLANELLDAFPVHRLKKLGGELYEIGAYVREDGELADCLLPLNIPEIAASAAPLCAALAEGQQLELQLDALRWLRRMCSVVKGGMLLFIDYGDRAEELRSEHRMNGTLMCYYRHQAHDDPYRNIGEQDMTAHVDFTACMRVAEEEGWRTHFYGTQKEFLVTSGIFDELQSHDDPNPFSEVAKRNRAIRQLLLSDGMSELFKVLVLIK